MIAGVFGTRQSPKVLAWPAEVAAQSDTPIAAYEALSSQLEGRRAGLSRDHVECHTTSQFRARLACGIQ